MPIALLRAHVWGVCGNERKEPARQTERRAEYSARARPPPTNESFGSSRGNRISRRQTCRALKPGARGTRYNVVIVINPGPGGVRGSERRRSPRRRYGARRSSAEEGEKETESNFYNMYNTSTLDGARARAAVAARCSGAGNANQWGTARVARDATTVGAARSAHARTTRRAHRTRGTWTPHNWQRGAALAASRRERRRKGRRGDATSAGMSGERNWGGSCVRRAATYADESPTVSAGAHARPW